MDLDAQLKELNDEMKQLKEEEKELKEEEKKLKEDEKELKEDEKELKEEEKQLSNENKQLIKKKMQLMEDETKLEEKKLLVKKEELLIVKDKQLRYKMNRLMDKDKWLRYKMNRLIETDKQLRDKMKKREQAAIDEQLCAKIDDECYRVYDKLTKFETKIEKIKQKVLDEINNQSQPDSKLTKLITNDEYPGDKYVANFQNLLRPELVDKLYSEEIRSNYSMPNLLIHELNKPSSSQISKIQNMTSDVADSEYTVIFGPSGCGKTRTAYEILSQYYGIYLSAFNDNDSDLSSVLSAIHESKALSLRPSICLYFKLQSIIAIRLIVLRVFREKLNISPYQWLIIQLKSKALFGRDIFYDLLDENNVDLMSEQVLSCKLASEEKDIGYMPILIDDAQFLLHEKNKFCTGTDLSSALNNLRSDKAEARYSTTLTKSALSPILYLARKLVFEKFRFFLSGTGFQADHFETVYRGSANNKSNLRCPAYVFLSSFSNPVIGYIKDLGSNFSS